MQFFYFHLMPWPYLPRDFDRRYDSAWVTLPNRLYDPKRGHRLYNEYLDELEHAERLGFDGLCVNEHHQNAYGTMPSPNLMAAALVRRTSRAKLAVLGNAIGLREHPLRVAEEIAMLDVLSGGRVISGFVRGIGCEHLSLGVNPTYSRERFYEAHDLIVQAWTRPGPFTFNGKHYKLRYVNPWPTPIQKPHPPIWIPGAGSLETMEFVAKRRYAYMGIPYFHKRVFQRNFDFFREACEKEGYTADPRQMGWLAPIYVAETDAQARQEYESHFWYFAKKLLPGIEISPPGYTTPRSALKMMGARNDFMLYTETWEQIEAGGYAIVGSPTTVRQRMEEMIKTMGVGNILALLQLGTLPADLTRKNMELFSREVLPKLRQLAPQTKSEGPRMARTA